jgi:hypothetical protein
MKVLKWVIINGMFLTAFYFGFVEGHEGAYNITMFVAWASIVISPFLLFDEMQKVLKKKGRSVPSWLNNTEGFLVAFAFAWFGAWVTGVFYLFHTIIQDGAYAKAEELEE